MTNNLHQTSDEISLAEGHVVGAMSRYRMSIPANEIAEQKPDVVATAIFEAVQHARSRQRSELVIEDVLHLAGVQDKRREKMHLTSIRQKLDGYIRSACSKIDAALISTRCVRNGKAFDIRYQIENDEIETA